MDRVKRFIKETQFLSLGFLFGAIAILSYVLAGEETGLTSISFLLAGLVFYAWLFIYLPIKFFINLKNTKKEKKKTKSVIIILFKALVWIIFIGMGVMYFLAMKEAGLE